MKSRLIREMVIKAPGHPRGQLAPVGTEIEHPLAWMHVICGFADPADRECIDKVESLGFDAEKITRARYVYERTSKGIHPDDYAKYDRGEIIGYNPDNSYIPGPNYSEDDDE